MSLQPQLSEQIGSLISQELLSLLSRAYPTRDHIASLTESDRSIGKKIGERAVLDFLQRCFDEANQG